MASEILDIVDFRQRNFRDRKNIYELLVSIYDQDGYITYSIIYTSGALIIYRYNKDSKTEYNPVFLFANHIWLYAKSYTRVTGNNLQLCNDIKTIYWRKYIPHQYAFIIFIINEFAFISDLHSYMKYTTVNYLITHEFI